MVSEAKALQGNQAGDLMSILKSNMVDCGISFDNVKITQIRLPGKMEEAIQATTEMKAALNTIQRRHGLNLTETKQRAELQLQQAVKQNERNVTEKTGEKRQAEQQAQVNTSNANADSDEKVLKAEEQCDVMK